MGNRQQPTSFSRFSVSLVHLPIHTHSFDMFSTTPLFDRIEIAFSTSWCKLVFQLTPYCRAFDYIYNAHCNSTVRWYSNGFSLSSQFVPNSLWMWLDFFRESTEEWQNNTRASHWEYVSFFDIAYCNWFNFGELSVLRGSNSKLLFLCSQLIVRRVPRHLWMVRLILWLIDIYFRSTCMKWRRCLQFKSCACRQFWHARRNTQMPRQQELEKLN